MTIINLKDKLIKLKGTTLKNGEESMKKGMALTYIRQCTAWGNNVLTEFFRRLRFKLPKNDLKILLLKWSCALLHNWRTK